MSKPSQAYMDTLPPHALVDFVKHLDVGGERTISWWWHYYNGHRGFHGDTKVFAYALVKAGMEKVPGSRAVYRKP